MTAVAQGQRAPTASPGAPTTLCLLGAGVAVAVLLVAAVAAALLFALAGGSWYIVQTPSMGTTAPVGTLLLDTPARIADLRVGDVVTFHPPTSPAEVYSHRVAAIAGDGVRTRGDINGSDDGWVVHQHDLLGRAVAVLPGAGWLVRALPIVVAGGLLTVFATRGTRGLRRAVARLLGVGLALALAAAWLHPFAGMVLLQTAASGSAVIATVVSTGVLPIRVSAPGGAAVHLGPGEVGRLRITDIATGHRVELASGLDLPWWGSAVLAACCLVPLLLCVAVLWGAALRRRRSAR